MNTPEEDQTPSNKDNHKKPNLIEVSRSVLAAFFGVQSSKNKERDFKHGSHRTFIIMGIVFTLVFIISIFSIVQFVIHTTKAG